MKKVCNRCKLEKDISGFGKDIKKADGFNSRCLECDRELCKRYYCEHRQEKLEKFREYAQTPEGRKTRNNASNNRYKKASPLVREARWRFREAVKSGKIEKGLCVLCGSSKVEGHHPDYNEPLGIVWLCRKHHTGLHKDIRYLTTPEPKQTERTSND